MNTSLPRMYLYAASSIYIHSLIMGRYYGINIIEDFFLDMYLNAMTTKR